MYSFFILINVFLSEIIDIPNYLISLRLNYVWPQSPINCYLWYGNYNMIGILMVWASVERQILIFHHQWLNTKKKRILIHYIPLITIILYTCIFDIVCICFVPCQANLIIARLGVGVHIMFNSMPSVDLMY
jgi:hypothetical protein